MSFEKNSTGNAGLDKVLDYLRIGDNVVWQVERIGDYIDYARSYAKASLANNRKVIYIRFAAHETILDQSVDAKKYVLHPSVGFESFTVEVHRIIEREGQEAFYVFDCLSNLLEAWATDLMISNFFQVTCPYLFQMKTIAYFALMRGSHSFDTVAAIRDTTQVLLDLYNIHGKRYIHPVKAWNRHSSTLFLPHVASGEQMIPVTNSAEASMLFMHLPRTGLGNVKRNLDYWDKLFMKAEELLHNPEQKSAEIRNQKQMMVSHLCKLIMGKEKKLLELAKKYFTLEDLLSIKSRLIGSGFIGEKSAGMLLARKILDKDSRESWENILEPHDSFYIGSDIFYTYLVQNGWWKLRLQQRTKEGFFAAADILGEEMRKGIFSEPIKEQFRQVTEYFGQYPFIIRSSSLLEDSFGNAFAGKYESVFCVNQGTPEERYGQFEDAVRSVYASSMNPDALVYRVQRGLDQADEQMSLLVQRVSGDYYKKYFFSFLSGVGFSYNNYVWKEDIDPEAGMIRLVLGLGTKAVGRVEGDYPRIASLDKPMLQPLGDAEDMRNYSQHEVDVLNLEKNRLESISLNKLMWEKTGANMDLIGVPDYETNEKIRRYNIKEQEAWILTYEKLFNQTGFIKTIRKLLDTLEKAYNYPVDVEFTVNPLSDERLIINLLQCRPLQTKGSTGKVIVPEELDESNIVFSTKGNFMGGSIDKVVKRIIYVDPKGYSQLSYEDKYNLARAVGKLNDIIKDKEEMPVMLVAPGRIGSSMPSMGIPISFAQISNMSILCETTYEIMGMTPELSYGSHFFQDLVETDIFYVSIHSRLKETLFNLSYFEKAPNILPELLPETGALQGALKVIDTEAKVVIKADIISQKLKCYKTGTAEVKTKNMSWKNWRDMEEEIM